MKNSVMRAIVPGNSDPVLSPIQEQLPNLLSSIQQLRLPLAAFQQHAFKGVPTARRHKVEDHYYPQETNLLWRIPKKPVPFIRFRGKWLEKLGFHCNKHIRIIALNQLLIICPEECSEFKEDLRNNTMEDIPYAPNLETLRIHRIA